MTSIHEQRLWCVSFLERVAAFLEQNKHRRTNTMKYRANPGEHYRVSFDFHGVVSVVEWRTGRHVVSSKPGRPTDPEMDPQPLDGGRTMNATTTRPQEESTA